MSKMTAESLKPFISLPSAENFSSERRSTYNRIAIGLSASFLILSVVLLGFTIWNSIRVCELQREVTSLNNIIGSMQKRLGIPYLEDLNEFENAFDNILDPTQTLGDEDDYDENDRYEDEDESDEDGNIKGIQPVLEDYGDDDILVGSGQYDDEDDDDDDDDDDGSNYENGSNEYIGPKESKSESRKTRSISSSSNGIPIYQDSYALKRNRTGGPEDERIEQHLLANKSPTPTLRPRPPTTESSTIQERGRYHSPPSNMLRSMNPPRQRVHRRLKNQRLLRPMLKSGKIRGKSQAMTATPYQRLTAVHYHLNNTISGRHVLHPDHSKLPHDGDVYIGAPHPWARTLGMEKAFDLNHGVLTVKDAGLYFIYAQIYYDNRFDRNGFVIYHNVHPFLQCALFVPTNANKSNTCYTSGVIFLESNDELHLRDIHRDRGVMLTNAKSFFGVIKLSEI